jgi:hypothetical protein
MQPTSQSGQASKATPSSLQPASRRYNPSSNSSSVAASSTARAQETSTRTTSPRSTAAASSNSQPSGARARDTSRRWAPRKQRSDRTARTAFCARTRGSRGRRAMGLHMSLGSGAHTTSRLFMENSRGRDRRWRRGLVRSAGRWAGKAIRLATAKGAEFGWG